MELRALALLDAMVGPHDLLANVRQLSRFEHGGSLVVAGEGDVVCSTQQVMCDVWARPGERATHRQGANLG